MLEFLAGLALTIWIVITLTHFIREERERGAERREARAERREAKLAARRAVGGLLSPHEERERARWGHYRA
jgi:hypothetical protein